MLAFTYVQIQMKECSAHIRNEVQICQLIGTTEMSNSVPELS
jgi:hypothetical protein